MLPFEFIVEGPPLSQQTRDRARLQAWKDTVRAEATRSWPQGQPPASGPLLITIVYFHERDTVVMDNDNMVKPIQDALSGLTYVDDRQITDTRVRKTRLDGTFRIRRMSPVIAPGFVRGVAFLYVRIQEAPDHTELL